jgi:type IV secretory pathway VirB3-like protein
MKARSVVFTHIQHPDSIFGLPPKMVVISISFAMAVFVLTILFGAVAISMIAFAITLVAGLALSYRLGRTDRHVESLFLTGVRFWGVSPRRWLLAGAAPDLRPRGGRS